MEIYRDDPDADSGNEDDPNEALFLDNNTYLPLDEHLYDGTALDEMFNDAVVSREEMREILVANVMTYNALPLSVGQSDCQGKLSCWSVWELFLYCLAS